MQNGQDHQRYGSHFGNLNPLRMLEDTSSYVKDSRLPENMLAQPPHSKCYDSHDASHQNHRRVEVPRLFVGRLGLIEAIVGAKLLSFERDRTLRIIPWSYLTRSLWQIAVFSELRWTGSKWLISQLTGTNRQVCCSAYITHTIQLWVMRLLQDDKWDNDCASLTCRLQRASDYGAASWWKYMHFLNV